MSRICEKCIVIGKKLYKCCIGQTLPKFQTLVHGIGSVDVILKLATYEYRIINFSIEVPITISI